MPLQPRGGEHFRSTPYQARGSGARRCKLWPAEAGHPADAAQLGALQDAQAEPPAPSPELQPAELCVGQHIRTAPAHHRLLPSSAAHRQLVSRLHLLHTFFLIMDSHNTFVWYMGWHFCCTTHSSCNCKLRAPPNPMDQLMMAPALLCRSRLERCQNSFPGNTQLKT